MSKKLNEKIKEQQKHITALKYQNASLTSLLEVVLTHTDDPKNGLFDCIKVAIKQGEDLCSAIAE